MTETQEVSVPNTAEDFEIGDRVWFMHPGKKVKMLATIVSHPVGRLFLRRDDGLLFSAAEDSTDSDTVIKVFMLGKILDVESLKAGMNVSKKVASKDGFIIRFHAVVERVRPGREVVLRAPDPSKNSYRQVVTHHNVGLDTLEYQLAGWEIEE